MSDKLLIWGRPNSVNVQKVLWTCAELALEFDRIDAGMQFGHVDTAEFRAMNPNGRVPVLVDGGFVLWESNAIIRYLALKHPGPLYPAGAAARACVERWLDWALSTLQPIERDLFWGMVRTKPEKRDMAVIGAAALACGAAWQVLDAHLADGRAFVEGDVFTLADVVLGAYARRWFGVEVANRPDFSRFAAWFARIGDRPGFLRYIAPTLT